jgi:predicted metalloprotease
MSEVDRVTLNLDGDEAVSLVVALEHLKKTSNGESLEHYESIYEKLTRSMDMGE